MEYNKLGLRAGLEIHQQLDTSRKLFCHCPAYLRSDEPDYKITRKLHKVAGESGEVDVAVEYESFLNRDFVYQCHEDNVCLLDIDECPPYSISEESLDVALQISLLLNCDIYQSMQIMRKMVIDGSNTSGFQRTVLIGHDGYVETSFGNVGIESIALEEDAARIIEKSEKKVIYRLDRLGIPLVEIATKPELYSAEQIKECALKIGEILRACRVKRGIGTIRQDVNISIKGHNRVEIKGFQEPRMMIKVVEAEIERQQRELLGGKNNSEVRNALPDGKTEFLRPLPGQARMYPETDLPLLKISRERINSLKKKLPKLKADIRAELKGKGLSDELIKLVLAGHLDEFETLMKVYPDNPELIAKMITLWRQETATKLKKSIEDVTNKIDEKTLEELLTLVKKGELDKGALRGVFSDIMSGILLEDAIKNEKISDDKLEEEISKIVKEKPGLGANAYMGLVMAKLKGKIDAKRAMEIINKAIRNN